MPTHLRHILIVDDDPASARLTRAALRHGAGAAPVDLAKDGDDALAFLRRQDAYAGAPRPDLILLDLNMPRKNGLAVLAEIKADPDLCRIPVVVVSTSDDPQDVRAAYEAHASGYVTKALDLEQFFAAMASLRQFWGETVLLPS